MSGLLAAASGLLLAAAFWGNGWSWLAWVALVPLFFALERCRDSRAAALTGYLFGLFFFGLAAAGIFSLGRFVGAWIIPGWLALVLFEALFSALFGWAYHWLKTLVRPERALPLILLAALAWTLAEKLRALGPFGFTLGGVGYSQAGFLPLVQIADLGQVYAVSALVVCFNLGLYYLLKPRGRWSPFLLAALLVAAALGYGYRELGSAAAPRPGRPALKLMIVQPNVDQLDRLNYRKLLPVLELQRELTSRNLAGRPDLIVWPEASVFQVFLLERPALLEQVRAVAVSAEAWFVLGAPHHERGKAFNSIYAFSPAGELFSRYDKQQLVPFGEYLPFRPLLYPLLSRVGYYDTEYSFPDRVRPLDISGLEVAAAVCFESLFPEVIRRRVSPASAFILLLTNDAWFDGTRLARFHLDCGIFRAVENRRYFVQAGNTGLSAVIDPWGRVAAELPP